MYLDSASLYLNERSESGELKFIGNQYLNLTYKQGGGLEETKAFLEEMIEIQNKAYEKKIEEEVFALKSANDKQELLARQNQEAEIKNLKLKSRNIIMSVIAVLTILIAFLIYRQRKFKFEKLSLQMQQRLLRSQMNPHFMSNTLYAIQNSVKKDQEGSINYLVKFSRLLRLILENSTKNFVLLESELESLKKYMDLQLVRFLDYLPLSLG